MEGMSAEDSPYPLPELAHGNVVRLKDEAEDPETGQAGRWGVIATHTVRNAFGVPMVQLVLYDDEHRLMMEANHVPEYHEYPASDFLLWHLSGGVGYDPVVPGGFDLYPTCATCKGTGNNPNGSGWCSACGGSGHATQMRRLPDSAMPKPFPEI